MADQTTASRSTKVFISYSRKDKLFVRKLNDALDAAGINAWVDWEGIPLSSDWMAEITQAIEGADAFLFVISPSSLTSKVCGQELELGITLNKKVVPILYRDPVKGTKVHPKIGSTNWVYMRSKKDDFKATVPKLIEAIETDLEWVKQHTRLLQRGNEWVAKNRNNSYTLQGSDLEDGEKWMTESTARPNRQVVPLQAEYISTSRKVAIKRQRSLMTGIALAFVVSVVMGVFALFQRNESVKNEAIARTQESVAIASGHVAATEQARAEISAQLAAANENLAKAQRSAAQAKIYEERPGELTTSTLLALDAWGRSPSPEAEDILRHNISFLPLPVTQVNHTRRIVNIHPSQDGSLFVTSSEDGSACVWTMPDATLKFCVQHDLDLTDAFLTADNTLLITASADGTVRFWNGADGTAGEVFNFQSYVWDIDISPDNQWLGVGRADGTLTVIDLGSREVAVSIDWNYGEIFTVAFDPTSKWIAIGTDEGNVAFWRVNSAISFAGPKHTAPVYALAFSSEGKWVVSVGEDSTARLARTDSGGEKYSIRHGDWVEDVAFGPDGSWFATVSDDNLVHVWDTETEVEKLRMGHGNFVLRVEVSPNGQWIASASFDNTVRVWDSASGALMKEITLNGDGTALAFSPDGNRIIAGDSEGHVSIWDISELNARVGYITFPEIVYKAKFNATGEWALFNSDDKKVWQIPITQLTTLHDGTGGTPILSLANITTQFKISTDSKWIVIAEKYADLARLYNLETKISLPPLTLDADVTGLSFSGDSSLVATTSENGDKVIVWNVNTGGKTNEVQFDRIPLTISFDPIHSSILAVGFTGKSVLWDLGSGREIAALAQIGDIGSLTYSKDGKWLATTSSEGSVFLWDMQGSDLSTPKYKLQQSGRVTSLDFSGDNQLLASAGGNFAYLWDLTTGQEYARLPHSNAVTSVSFSADDGLLITAARKTVQVWDVNAIQPVNVENIVDMACTRLIENMSQSDWNYFFNDETYKRACPNLPDGQ
jgi:WD40 repeat protein